MFHSYRSIIIGCFQDELQEEDEEDELSEEEKSLEAKGQEDEEE